MSIPILDFIECPPPLGLNFSSETNGRKVTESKLTESKSEFKRMLKICTWPKHLILLNLINSDITINKMAKVLITFIS